MDRKELLETAVAIYCLPDPDDDVDVSMDEMVDGAVRVAKALLAAVDEACGYPKIPHGDIVKAVRDHLADENCWMISLSRGDMRELLRALGEACPRVFPQLDTATQNKDAEFTVCRTDDLRALVEALRCLRESARDIAQATKPLRPESNVWELQDMVLRPRIEAADRALAPFEEK